MIENFKETAIYKPVAISAPGVEELNVLEVIAQNWMTDNNQVKIWSQGEGWEKLHYSPTFGISTEPDPDYVQCADFDNSDLIDALLFLQSEDTGEDEKRLYILIDVEKYLEGEHQNLAFVRKLKSTINGIRQSNKKLCLLGANVELPVTLEGCLEEISYSLPDSCAIEQCIQECLTDLQNIATIEFPSQTRKRLIRVCQGLTIAEIRDAIYLHATTHSFTIDDTIVDFANNCKIKKLQKLNVKFSPPPNVEVGGLSTLKNWINNRTRLFNAQVEGNDLSLPIPKGVMLVGIPGTGKSLIAKTIGSIWSVPILSVNFGDLYDSLVGETEKNMNQLLKMASAIAPCVLFMDEIEKALAGASNSNDSGVSSRIFGSFLNWMQEKTAPVFVVATANDVRNLPPELTRKGRFDEIFFVDLPTEEERVEILNNHIKHPAITPLKESEVKEIARLTKNFSGAEIGSLIESALITSFSEDRYGQISKDDILKEAQNLVPVASRYELEVSALREWAKTSARIANAVPISTPKTQGKRNKSSRPSHSYLN